MLKKLTFLALILASLLATTVKSEAQAAQLYRWSVRINSGVWCWGGATVTDSIMSYNVIDDGITNWHMHEGSSLIVTISQNPVACNCPHMSAITLGHVWEEVSYNQGITWYLLSPTFVPLTMGAEVTTQIWSVDSTDHWITGASFTCAGF